jgi:hypothetical protein
MALVGRADLKLGAGSELFEPPKILMAVVLFHRGDILHIKMTVGKK